MTSNTHSNEPRPDDTQQPAPLEAPAPTEQPGTEQSGTTEQAGAADQNGSDSSEVLGGPTPTTTEKDPSDWVTGDEPMTGAQRSYLDTLAREAGEELSADMTKAEASEHIDRLQERTGRDGG